jgi:hypothetical protein
MSSMLNYSDVRSYLLGQPSNRWSCGQTAELATARFQSLQTRMDQRKLATGLSASSHGCLTPQFTARMKMADH